MPIDYGNGVDDGLGQSTYVSNPSAPQDAPTPTSPGSQGVGKSLAVHHAVIYVIGGAALALFAIGYVFRRPIGEA